MTVAPPQQVQIKCPNCSQPFRTVIFSMIDVGQQPELKGALLSGQLNVAVCPNCGAGSLIGTPLIYHDPAKQLFLAYFPQELNARPEDQERYIGEMATMALRSLPADAPKGYLLSPKRFLSLQSLLDAVLEAEGISREAINAQRQRIALIGRLAEALDDEARFSALVAQSRDQIDYDTLALLSAYIDASAQEGRPESAAALSQLRERLIELTGISGPEDDEAADAEDSDVEALIDQLVAADDAALPALLSEQRADIDYAFFERLTDRIDAAAEAGDAAEAERLTARRQQILETVEALDREAQAAFEQASQLLREVLDAPDFEAALRERLDGIDDAFMFVLDASEVQAARAGAGQQLLDDLATIRELALKVVDESLTPEERLINQILQLEAPQERTRLLRQNAVLVTPAFVKRLNELADQLDGEGRTPDSEQVRRLAREAGAMLF